MTTWPILSVVTFLPTFGALLIYVSRGNDAAAERNAIRKGPSPEGIMHWLSPSMIQRFSSIGCSATSAFTTFIGTNRALL